MWHSRGFAFLSCLPKSADPRRCHVTWNFSVSENPGKSAKLKINWKIEDCVELLTFWSFKKWIIVENQSRPKQGRQTSIASLQCVNFGIFLSCFFSISFILSSHHFEKMSWNWFIIKFLQKRRFHAIFDKD